MKKLIITIATASLLVAAIFGATAWVNRTIWPEFAAVKDNTPQAVLKVERDYAHHIGDLIVVDLFIHQQPGTDVDGKTLSITGDYELVSKPEVKTKEAKDGSVTYRYRLNLQTFKVKPEHKLEGSIGWRADDKRHDLTLPALSLYWSNTYDGRTSLMEGDDPRVPVLWYTLRHAIPLGLASLLFLALSAVAFLQLIKRLRQPKPVDHARVRVAELLALVANGTCTREKHLELDGLMRARYKLGPVPAGQLDSRLLDAQLVKFLRANEPAIYAEDALDANAQTELKAAGEALLKRWR
ncbi:MAG: hypothetical protein SGJ27_31385 [Candidatus Melainabacteria bacterium]|nr:hypothetical protein [Candidatus Melainabacteria bacterium]